MLVSAEYHRYASIYRSLPSRTPLTRQLFQPVVSLLAGTGTPRIRVYALYPSGAFECCASSCHSVVLLPDCAFHGFA